MHLGGDLAGLTKRLSYFRELRVNTLYLSNIFRGEGHVDAAIDLLHIDDAVGTTARADRPAIDAQQKNSSGFTPSDRLFLEFIDKAHRTETRVLVCIDLERIGRRSDKGRALAVQLADLPKRWMDPNGDGDPSDGVDGWIVREPQALPHSFWQRWRQQVKRVNPEALLVGDIEGDPAPWLNGDEFDVAVNYDVALALRRFFSEDRKASSLSAFLSSLQSVSQRWQTDRQLASPVPISGPRIGRALAAFSQRPANANPSGEASTFGRLALGQIHWRLATLIQHVLPGAPMLYHGDEAGMSSAPESGDGVMWWPDALPAGRSRKDYRADFAALTQFLHVQREQHPAFRRGSFRRVLADEKRGLLAFARALDGEEVILLIHFGRAKEKVNLAVGSPGQIITVVGPRLVPMAPPKPQEAKLVEPLRVGASRRIVRPDGTIRFWINPNTVRLIVVKP